MFCQIRTIFLILLCINYLNAENEEEDQIAEATFGDKIEERIDKVSIKKTETIDRRF